MQFAATFLCPSMTQKLFRQGVLPVDASHLLEGVHLLPG